MNPPGEDNGIQYPATAASLVRCGRTPSVPFCIALDDGTELRVDRLLRVLPGKRIVGEGGWQGRRVLAKLFISADSAQHAAREMQGVQAMQAAALPTPELLLSSRLHAGGHAVLSEFLIDAKSLSDEWEALQHLPSSHVLQEQCLQSAFALLGQMHAAGLIHEDVHLSNFLRHAGRLYVIDGDAVHTVSGNGRQTQANLALLLAQLPISWDGQQGRLLSFYTGPVYKADELAKAVQQARQKRLKKFLSKTGRNCTQFLVRQTTGEFVAMLRTEADWLSLLLESKDRLVDEGHKYKDGGTCSVARVGFSGHELVIKRYNLKSVLHALSRACRPSRAWHSWRAGHMLLHLGIATPAPLALCEERIGPIRRRAFLVNAFCPGENLLEHLSPEVPPGEAEAHSLLTLFDALRVMRISHGDLKANNLLWHNGRVVVIDLDGMRWHASLAGWQRAWRRDRARFLANWPETSVLYRWLDEHLA